MTPSERLDAIEASERDFAEAVSWVASPTISKRIWEHHDALRAKLAKASGALKDLLHALENSDIDASQKSAASLNAAASFASDALAGMGEK